MSNSKLIYIYYIIVLHITFIGCTKFNQALLCKIKLIISYIKINKYKLYFSLDICIYDL